MPKVSVIVPNYNYGRFLKQRLETILVQTFQDFELILLDDCSTDDSREVMEAYVRHPKVSHVVMNDRNTGSPFVQWERGLQLAAGEYVWIAESDDYASPVFLETAMRAFEAHPKAVIAAVCSQFVDKDGADVRGDYDGVSLDGTVRCHASEAYIRHNLYWGATIYNASGVVFSREAYTRIGKAYTTMRYSGDYMFWTELAGLGSVIKIHQRLNFFRQHEKRVTVNSEGTWGSLRELLDIHLFIWEHYPQGLYREWMSKGCLYKRLKRSKMDRGLRKQYFREIKHGYGITAFHYCFERVCKTLGQIFPFITTPGNDQV